MVHLLETYSAIPLLHTCVGSCRIAHGSTSSDLIYHAKHVRRKWKMGSQHLPNMILSFIPIIEMGVVSRLEKYFFKRSVEDSKKQVAQNDFELRDLVVYLAIHVLCFLTSLV